MPGSEATTESFLTNAKETTTMDTDTTPDEGNTFWLTRGNWGMAPLVMLAVVILYYCIRNYICNPDNNCCRDFSEFLQTLCRPDCHNCCPRLGSSNHRTNQTEIPPIQSVTSTTQVTRSRSFEEAELNRLEEILTSFIWSHDTVQGDNFTSPPPSYDDVIYSPTYHTPPINDAIDSPTNHTPPPYNDVINLRTNHTMPHDTPTQELPPSYESVIQPTSIDVTTDV